MAGLRVLDVEHPIVAYGVVTLGAIEHICTLKSEK